MRSDLRRNLQRMEQTTMPELVQLRKAYLARVQRPHSTVLKSRDKMDEKISIFLVVLLAIGGLTMMTALLTCYACIFRDLCCRPENRSKRRRQQNSQRELDNPNRIRLDAIQLNDITQGESMPTESEKL